jgi:hypothetical protein
VATIQGLPCTLQENVRLREKLSEEPRVGVRVLPGSSECQG